MTLPDDVAWLVECPKYHPGEYFALCECGCGRHHWTKDVHAATKFPTKDAAEAARGGDQNCIAFEHMFGLKLPRTTALPDDVVEGVAQSLCSQLDLNGHTLDGIRTAARAALEAARYGELVEAIDHLLHRVPIEPGMNREPFDRLSALLSSIGTQP